MVLPIIRDGGRFRKFGRPYSDGIHLGHDFDCPKGTVVRAICDGVVLRADMVEGFGALNPVTPEQKKSTKGGMVLIKHKVGNEYITALYGHIIYGVKTGDFIEEGKPIGIVANFTNYDQVLPHLHFGIWNSDSPIEGHLGYDSMLRKWIPPIIFLQEHGAK